METWIIYGLLAALLLGVSGLLAKMVAGKEHFALESHSAVMLMGAGAVVIFFTYYLLESKGSFSFPPGRALILLALGSGAFWALATVLVYKAFNAGANASQIVPLYNLNTLVVVILAILLLHELPNPQQALRVLAGAVLMIIGAFLVS